MNSSPDAEIRRKVVRALGILEERFGSPTWHPKAPLDELMVTILSQNTSGGNRDLAYGRLRERFAGWRAVMEAEVTEVEAAIRPAGLAGQKAARMQAILRWVEAAFGELDLAPLALLNLDEALEVLTSQKGIGIKTAAVVLAFAFGRDLCPVDTHVHRIARRLGWVPRKSSAEATFRALRRVIPPGKAASFHLNLLKFGRSICSSRSPDCGQCPLWNDCIWEGKGVGTR